MNSVEQKVPRISERLATSGFRFTPQREHVYNVLLGQRDHPTAEQVFMRAKAGMPDISLATVYNCLDALVRSDLVKQVTVDRGASHFCPNMHEHCHFQCERCGGIFDIALAEAGPAIPMPRGFKATHIDVSIRGLCPDCGGRRKS
jgi:Fe2+ or Zn2+ uptake regulation protein